MELGKVAKQTVEIRNPQNQNDDDHTIEDRFDLSLHGNEPVHKPQQQPDCDDRDDDGGKRHSMFSIRFFRFDSHSGRRLRDAGDRFTERGISREEKSDSRLHSYSSKATEKLLSYSAHPIRWGGQSLNTACFAGEQLSRQGCGTGARI
jgi:hypothetical protein